MNDTYMRGSDAFSWYMERDPILRSTIVTVAWLACSPDWERLVERVRAATDAVALFATRVAETPGRLVPPRRVRAEDPDLMWHVRRTRVAGAADDAAVLELARGAATTPFDPARPLWQFTLVEGLAGDRAALLMKLHHSLTDGVGGMKLALNLFDLTPEQSPPVPAGSVTAEPDRHALVEALRDGAGALGGAARHPLHATADVLEMARSIGRTVAPVFTTLSPVMKGRGLRRELRTIAVPLASLKTAAHRGGSSLNDAFLAGLTGGLRRYHAAHGASVDELRVTMPISIRKQDDPDAGNRITLQRFVVPLGPEDPLARMRDLDARCRRARDERSLPLTNAIAAGLNLLPSAAVGSMLKHVDFLASDVPGFPVPLYLVGAEVTALVAFGPTIGAAFNATLLSYNGTCHIGLVIDGAAVRDPDVLVDCLRQGFAEVCALAA